MNCSETDGQMKEIVPISFDVKCMSVNVTKFFSFFLLLTTYFNNVVYTSALDYTYCLFIVIVAI